MRTRSVVIWLSILLLGFVSSAEATRITIRSWRDQRGGDLAAPVPGDLGYEAFRAGLLGQGYVILPGVADGILSGAALSAVDVFFHGATSHVLTGAEQAALATFVQRGGSVIVEANSDPGGQASANSVIAALGGLGGAQVGPATGGSQGPATGLYTTATGTATLEGPHGDLRGDAFGSSFVAVVTPGNGTRVGTNDNLVCMVEYQPFGPDGGRVLICGDPYGFNVFMEPGNIYFNSNNLIAYLNLVTDRKRTLTILSWRDQRGGDLFNPVPGSLGYGAFSSGLQAQGYQILPGVPDGTLDRTDFSGVDVFFHGTTSHSLTAGEQAALGDFVQRGGFLIAESNSAPGEQAAANSVIAALGGLGGAQVGPNTGGASGPNAGTFTSATGTATLQGPHGDLRGGTFGSSAVAEVTIGSGILVGLNSLRCIVEYEPFGAAGGRFLLCGDPYGFNLFMDPGGGSYNPNNLAAYLNFIADRKSGCVWGSFDATRINYPDGLLTGAAHSALRTIIGSVGGIIGPPTSTLTEAYLNTVEVFYTSLLSQQTGTLSAAEQAALQQWISRGGTLIVTADIFPLPAYESFTAFYGVTNYTALSNSGAGNVLAAHPVTTGVATYDYDTESTYTYGADALLLGDNGLGRDFMIVMEPGTGFNAGGRILVTGDHNMFTNSRIGNLDNTRLASNLAAWACSGGALGVAGGAPGAGSLRVSIAPNPFFTDTAFRLEGGAGGPVTIAVYDVTGRLVARMNERLGSGSPELVRWDGRDVSGRPVAQGAYFYRVEAPEAGQVTGKLVRIR